MNILIDSPSLSSIDYTGCVAADKPIRIERKLNEAPRCTAGLLVGGTDAPAGSAVLPAPPEGAFVQVSSGGTVLFRGYVAGGLASTLVGKGAEGPLSLVHFVALGEEQGAEFAGVDGRSVQFGGDAGQLLRGMIAQRGAGLLDTTALASANAVGVYRSHVGASVLEAVRDAAMQSHVAVRTELGAMSATDLATVTHTFDGPAVLETSTLRVTDVTVCGEVEPAAYVTEVFRGDGTTDTFQLGRAPFHATDGLHIDDAFALGQIDAATWSRVGSMTDVHAGAGGLMLNGGTGVDGATYLAATAPVEMGGTLFARADGVTIGAGSDGVLCGFYSGTVQVAHCVAGVRIRQSGGATIAVALVNGVETGAAFSVTAGHRYSFRVRVHADEALRVKQVFPVRVNDANASFGGGTVPSAMRVVCDVQDLGLATSTAATVLCDASIAVAPAVCTFAAVNALQMFGSVRRVQLRDAGTAWVRSRDAYGAERTRPARHGERCRGCVAELERSAELLRRPRARRRRKRDRPPTARPHVPSRAGRTRWRCFCARSTELRAWCAGRAA